MRVHVKEYQPLLVVLYPIVGFAGMMQVDTVIKVARLATPLGTLAPLGMFVVALAYTAVLTAFLAIMDGENSVFKVVASFLLSAICAALFYFGATFLVYLVTAPFGAEVHLDQGALQPWFALATLVAGAILAFIALYFVESTDIRDFSKPMILGTQVVYVFVGVFALYSMGVVPTGLSDLFMAAK